MNLQGHNAARMHVERVCAESFFDQMGQEMDIEGGDFLDVESPREMRISDYVIKKRWEGMARVKNGDFDYILSDLFSDWEHTGFRKAINQTGFRRIDLESEENAYGDDKLDLRRFLEKMEKPQAVLGDPYELVGAYLVRGLVKSIGSYFAMKVTGVLNGSRTFPLFVPYHYESHLAIYARDFMLKHGYIKKK